MYHPVSPPKFKFSYVGGSNQNSSGSSTKPTTITGTQSASSSKAPTSSGSVNFGEKSTCRSNSLQSQNLTGSTTSLLSDVYKKHATHYSPSRQSNYGGKTSRNTSFSGGSTKRTKKTWGNKDRAGMSFLIVIVFFAVFGLIILTELFMIDERSHAGMAALRHGSVMGRLGDSMPDYDNVKDDYDLLEDNLLGDQKLGFVQMRDNKFKIQEADGGVLGARGVGLGLSASRANVPIIPWGKVLPATIEESLPHFPFGIRSTDGSWQIVNGTSFKFFVFSAFYDRRDGAKLVRVIGATKTRGPERVWCRFWYSSRHNLTHTQKQFKSITVMARVKVIRENWNLKYSACFVLCPVRVPELQVPDYVSVVSRLRTPPGNVLLVRNTDWDADFKSSPIATNTSTTLTTITNSLRNLIVPVPPLAITSSEHIPDRIAVCVKPFHFNYDQALFLMEYIELYALLGVSHFTFYNHTVGPHASCVLQHYMQGNIPENLTAFDLEPPTAADLAAKFDASARSTSKPSRHLDSPNYSRPTVEILPWNLRMRSQKEIRTEGLFAALNDCVYRSMYRYKYLALVDLDEFIIPRHKDTLDELIKSLNQRFRNRNTGAYSFQNAFFYLQFPDDPMVMQPTSYLKNVDPRIRASLVTQRKTKRRFKLHPQKQRSKYICKPEAVVEAGNHFVWEFSPNKGALNVPPTEAILQHYRVCEFGGNDCIKAPSVVDRTATKYVNRLVQRVHLVYKHLKHSCQLPDLPPVTVSSATLSTEISNEDKIPNEIKMNVSTKKIQLEKPKKNPNAELQDAKTLKQQPITQINITRTSAVRLKRKLVVFEPNARGVVKARVEFEHKTQG